MHPIGSPAGERTAGRRSLRRLLAPTATVAAAMLLAPSAQAADLQATPSNLSTVFANAQGGDTIHLAAGSYGQFRGGRKASMVTLVADPGIKATLSASFDGATFVRLRNLTITQAYVARSHDIQFVGNTFTGGTRIDTTDNSDMRVLMDGNKHDGINVCSSCYEGRITVIGNGSNSAPNGIRITNSHFSGGNSDGVQITGYAYGTQIGPGNVFEKIVMVDATHSDAIQLYHSRRTQIVGNFLYRNETGIMAADGADHEVIKDNVITTKADGTGYPWPIVLGADNGSLVQHNTLPDGACNWNMRCGVVRIDGGNQKVASRGTMVKDNILGALGVSGGSALAEEHHNLIANSTGRDATDIKGKPTFTGGAAPTTWAGFALATGSLGKANASDGKDRGAAVAGSTPAPAPADTPAKAVWTAPTGVRTGQAVTLDGTRSEGDPPLSCAWSFENQDGSTIWETRTGCKISMTFSNADTKYVKLTVRDADGDTNANRQSFPVTR